MANRGSHIEIKNYDQATQARPRLTPQERAHERSAEWISQIVLYVGGAAVLVMWAITFFFMSKFTIGFAPSWQWVPAAIGIAFVYTCFAGLGPLMSLLTEQKSQKDAKGIMLAWFIVVSICVGVAVYNIFASSSWTSDYAPKAILPGVDAAGNLASRFRADPEQLRKAFSLLFVLAPAALGLAIRWGAISVSQAHTLGEITQPAPAPSQDVTSLMPVTGAGDIMEQWWNYAVRQRPGAQVTFRKLYADYLGKCEGICNPMTDKAFSKVLKNLIDTPNSGISKRASNGDVIYEGIELVDQDQNVIEMVPLQQIGRG